MTLIVILALAVAAFLAFQLLENEKAEQERSPTRRSGAAMPRKMSVTPHKTLPNRHRTTAANDASCAS